MNSFQRGFGNGLTVCFSQVFFDKTPFSGGTSGSVLLVVIVQAQNEMAMLYESTVLIQYNFKIITFRCLYHIYSQNI